jgi:hypothetical protein
MIMVALVTGGLVVLAGQWLGAGNRPAADTVYKLFPIKCENIAEKDRWLLNCDVHFVPVENILTDCSYGLLVVIPKFDQITNLPSGGESEFILDGYVNNDEKPLFIDTSYFQKYPGKPEIILLDFLQWPKMSDKYIEGKTLVLRSNKT